MALATCFRWISDLQELVGIQHSTDIWKSLLTIEYDFDFLHSSFVVESVAKTACFTCSTRKEIDMIGIDKRHGARTSCHVESIRKIP
jgi:hypothetical protein